MGSISLAVQPPPVAKVAWRTAAGKIPKKPGASQDQIMKKPATKPLDKHGTQVLDKGLS